MNGFSRGLKNAFRNGIRTMAVCLILALIMGLTLAMLVANSSVNDQIADIQSSIGNKITVSAAGTNGPGGMMQMGGMFGGGMIPGMPSEGDSSSSESGVTLTNDDVDTVSDIEHITSVSTMLTEQVDSDDTSLTGVKMGRRGNDDNESDTGESETPTISISVTGLTDIDMLSDSMGEIELSEGDGIDLASDDMVAVIGDQLAAQNDLSVGDTFTLYDKEVTVKGIVSSGEDDNSDGEGEMASIGRNLLQGSLVVMPLASLQQTADSDEVTTIVATVDNVNNTDVAVDDITVALGTTDDGNNVADVTSDKQSAESAISSLESISTMSLVSVVVCAIVAAVIIFLAMLMVVRERRSEIGIMKAIGAKNHVIITQFVVESLVITVIASVIGLGIGVVGAAPLTKALVSDDSTTEVEQSSDMFSGKFSGSIDPSNLPDNNNLPDNIDFSNPAEMFGDSVAAVNDVVAKVDWTIVIYALVGCLLVAGCGASAASMVAMRVKPAEAVRAE